MRQIKSSGTKLERIIEKELLKRGFEFDTNAKDLPGKPDFAFRQTKKVIFIDSCFWHGCKEHCRLPKTNSEYWQNKISKNVKRDNEINQFTQNLIGK